MKFILTALLLVAATAFAGEKRIHQTEKTTYGTRSDGKVVPTSKETRRTKVKERPQMEEEDDYDRTEETTIRKTKRK